MLIKPYIIPYNRVTLHYFSEGKNLSHRGVNLGYITEKGRKQVDQLNCLRTFLYTVQLLMFCPSPHPPVGFRL